MVFVFVHVRLVGLAKSRERRRNNKIFDSLARAHSLGLHIIIDSQPRSLSLFFSPARLYLTNSKFSVCYIFAGVRLVTFIVLWPNFPRLKKHPLVWVRENSLRIILCVLKMTWCVFSGDKNNSRCEFHCSTKVYFLFLTLERCGNMRLLYNNSPALEKLGCSELTETLRLQVAAVILVVFRTSNFKTIFNYLNPVIIQLCASDFFNGWLLDSLRVLKRIRKKYCRSHWLSHSWVCLSSFH